MTRTYDAGLTIPAQPCDVKGLCQGYNGSHAQRGECSKIQGQQKSVAR